MAELASENFPQEEDEDDRRSFDRWSEGSRDEFWDALSSNYDYLMDDGLIATCREASSDLSVDEEADLPEEDLWTFGRFTEQFRRLHDLLHNLQRDSRRREGTDEERQKIAHMCRLFNEHAQHLCRRHPDMREEVHRRLNLLNNKWKAVLGSLKPSKDALFDEIADRMRSLRRWLREVEGRLSPVPSASPNTLKEKHQKQIALQKEIEEKGKCVNSLLKVCGRLEGSVRFGASLTQWDAERVRRVASNLEHRWHALWISSLERQYSLEGSLHNTGHHEKLEKSFSEEPLTKYPRLSESFEAIQLLENELGMMAKSNEVLLDIAKTRNKGEATVSKNDKAVMVGDTGITALKADCGTGKFEIVQDVGYSSETSAHFSTDDRHESKDKVVCPSVPYLSPDKYPSVSLKALNILSDERSFRKQGGCKSVPDTFYKMACVDDLPEEDTADHPRMSSGTPKAIPPKKSGHKFHAGERDRARPNDLLKRSVCEWLDKCHLADGGSADINGESKLKSDWLLKVGNNSCDASGECTTNESDSEKSTSDVNNSVTFSQSFTGSIETVIPSTVEPSPCVRLRSKKRCPTRGRPWSVIELNRATVAPSVPHSTSEGALDTLHRSSMPKRKKRLSLTDISPCPLPSPSAMDDSKALLSETNSLLTTEDQASLSDQAWDEYQDPPYLSEPYSEQTIDEDEVRKLISFGDDYRATLGSYSDGSSVSLRPARHRNRTKAAKLSGGGGDSVQQGQLSSDTNSDCEDFHHILKTSGHTLQFVGHTMKEGAPSSKHAELIATTQTNLCLLKEIAAARCELESVSKEDVQKLQDLIGEWEELQTRLLVLSKSSSKEEEEQGEETSEIHASLKSLRGQLGVMEEQANLAIGTATSLEQLNANIQELQCALSQLQDMKACVLHVSARVLRLGNDSSLREGATLLYQRWEDVYELNCTQLTKLQKLQFGWGKSTEEQIEEHLETMVQWQPVQVEISLPTAEVRIEDHRLTKVGAEVQTSERHDALLEMAEGVSPLVGEEKLHNVRSSGTAEKKTGPASCLWRVLRASFPFQLLLLLLFCLSCHTEPRCCENINNYDFSVHLRYLGGPPPV